MAAAGSEAPRNRGPEGPEPTRREFVDLVLAGSLGATAIAALVPAALFLVPPEQGEAEATVVLDFKAEDLAPNTGRIFRHGSQPGLVLKTPDGELRAFSAKCTHLSCIVRYVPEQGRIHCNCHSGWFDLTGRNVAGPPPRPLEPFRVDVRRAQDGEGHEIVVSRT